MLPDPTSLRSLVSALLRTAVFLFIAEPFIGSCWQLWVGGLIFLVPALRGLVAERLPNSELHFRLIPRGVAMVLFLLVVGLGAAHLVQSLTQGHDDAVRNGFVLLSLPGLVISVLSLVGRDGPLPGRSWRYELLGTVVVALVARG
jgi:hypothetical protein